MSHTVSHTVSDSPWDAIADFTADPAVGAQLSRRGWAVVDLLTPREVAALREALGPWPDAPLVVRMLSDDVAWRRRVSAAARAAAAPALPAHLRGYRDVVGVLMAKRGGVFGGNLPLHQDWSFVDEASHCSLNLWVPLRDVGPDSGCIWAVPGSHRLPWHLRTPRGPCPVAAFREALAPLQRPIPMRAGQGLLHAHSLVHASLPSFEPPDRPAVAFVFVPELAPLLHFHWQPGWPEDRYTRHEVDPAFFTDHRLGEAPAPRWPGREVRHPPPIFDAGGLVAALSPFQ